MRGCQATFHVAICPIWLAELAPERCLIGQTALTPTTKGVGSILNSLLKVDKHISFSTVTIYDYLLGCILLFA